MNLVFFLHGVVLLSTKHMMTNLVINNILWCENFKHWVVWWWKDIGWKQFVFNNILWFRIFQEGVVLWFEKIAIKYFLM